MLYLICGTVAYVRGTAKIAYFYAMHSYHMFVRLARAKKGGVMFGSFGEFFTALKEAKLGFDVIWDLIKTYYYGMTADPDVSVIWDGVVSAAGPVIRTLSIVFVLFSLLVALFGKKMMGFLKFVFFLTLGFFIGTHTLAGMIPPNIKFPAWIVGIVVALVAAVLSRFLYIILYSVAFGYSGYLLIYNGFYLQSNPVYTSEKALGCIIVALIILTLSLVFRKYIEMVGTAFLGAWLAVWLFVNYVFAFTLSVGIMMIPTAIFAILGVIVQFKTRRRY